MKNNKNEIIIILTIALATIILAILGIDLPIAFFIIMIVTIIYLVVVKKIFKLQKQPFLHRLITITISFSISGFIIFFLMFGDAITAVNFDTDFVDFKNQQESYENIVDYLRNEYPDTEHKVVHITKDGKNLYTNNQDDLLDIPKDISDDLYIISINGYVKYGDAPIEGTAYDFIRIEPTQISFNADETGKYSVVHTNHILKNLILTNLGYSKLSSGWYEVVRGGR